MLSWCSVSRYSATTRAALRSGDSWRPTEGFEPLAALFVPAGGDGGDEARVEPPGEKDADRHVAHHLAFDRCYELVAYLAQDLLRDRSPRLRGAFEALVEVLLVAGDGVGEAHEAVFGSPVVARRESLYIRLP